jgi:hypothetical protein
MPRAAAFPPLLPSDQARPEDGQRGRDFRGGGCIRFWEVSVAAAAGWGFPEMAGSSGEQGEWRGPADLGLVAGRNDGGMSANARTLGTTSRVRPGVQGGRVPERQWPGQSTRGPGQAIGS